MLLTTNILWDAVALLATAISSLLIFAYWRLGYWSRKGLYDNDPVFFFGNAKKLIMKQQNIGEMWKELYENIRAKGLKHGGGSLLFSPTYVPVDLDIIKNIMQQDFQHFNSHGTYFNEKGDPLSAHLFALSRQKWRNLRTKLTPTFTSGKMKMMFSRLVECGEGLKEMMDEFSQSGKAMDIKEMLQRFTIDIIVSCAFGLECDTMKNPDNDFASKGRNILKPESIGILRILSFFALPHSLLHKLNVRLTDRETESFFMNVVKKNVEYREKNNVYRKDFMHLLLQLKNRGKVADDEHLTSDGTVAEGAITFNELAAQAFVFFVAGYETSSTTMTFALYEIARDKELQNKMRQEIREVLKKNDGKLTYEAVKDMELMSRVVEETLRKYPAISMIPRECTKDYQIPGTDITIEKGTSVAISTLGIHRDPEYYPDPLKFDPDRFLEENKRNRHPFAWIPFGEGPRACIGLRFGVMQTKVGLASILENYDISLSEKTQVPLEFNKSGGLILSAKGGVWINVTQHVDN
ncbi:probable cytochrome P450 6a23 [Aethina tumida]|uniref:probable cytochrome P450 6a23 n=1 Tax=Aethina tumida TaxID=116153 RepID=UPI002148F6D0|nr:probable cytochrome P450 6a23 [Aethina tumida]